MDIHGFISAYKQALFQTTEHNFEAKALELFQFQAEHNLIYRQYLDYLRINYQDILRVDKIPFIPISFFKYNVVTTGEFITQTVFESSGTTHQTIFSKHHIEDIGFYHRNSLTIFEQCFGSIDEYVVLGLLPSYIERGNSSLVNMAQFFIDKSGSPESGFYLNNFEDLAKMVNAIITDGNKKPLIIGVTYALLEFAMQYPQTWPEVMVIETGGMKGRQAEMQKTELHAILKNNLGLGNVYSEYGMTELLSQGYTNTEGLYRMPAWARAYRRELNDPFAIDNETGKIGGLNIIDLANVATCAFLETQDLTRLHSNFQFEVLGRIDNAELRGCSLMVL